MLLISVFGLRPEKQKKTAWCHTLMPSGWSLSDIIATDLRAYLSIRRFENITES